MNTTPHGSPLATVAWSDSWCWIGANWPLTDSNSSRRILQVDTIDPLPGWQPGNPAAIYVAALARTTELL